jgi:hypothetical protein
VKQLELISKDMALEGEKGLFSWIASTWSPYTAGTRRVERGIYK